MKNLAVLTLLLFTVTSGCHCTDKKIIGKWQKANDPEMIIEFTSGRHFFVTNEGITYRTRYFNRSNSVVEITVANLEIKHSAMADGDQKFTKEISSSGELILVISSGQYRDKDIIKQIAGRYISLEAPDIGTLSTAARIDACLHEVTPKVSQNTAQLARLQADHVRLSNRLRQMGVTCAADLKGKPDAQEIAREFTEVARLINRITARNIKYADLINQLKLAKRNLERQKTDKQTSLAQPTITGIEKIFAEAKVISKSALEQDLETEITLDEELKTARHTSSPQPKTSRADLPLSEPLQPVSHKPSLGSRRIIPPEAALTIYVTKQWCHQGKLYRQVAGKTYVQIRCPQNGLVWLQCQL